MTMISEVVECEMCDRFIRQRLDDQQRFQCGPQADEALDDEIQKGGVVVVLATVLVTGWQFLAITAVLPFAAWDRVVGDVVERCSWGNATAALSRWKLSTRTDKFRKSLIHAGAFLAISAPLTVPASAFATRTIRSLDSGVIRG